jgi:hypothetical protein
VRDEEREDHGPPPDAEAIAELLAERHTLKKGDQVTVETLEDPLPGLIARLDSGRDRYEIAIEYLRGAGERDAWMLLSDALDALFGTFIESGLAYRDLPTGDDVEYEGGFFRVRVTRDIPELSLKADRLLGESN